MTTIRLAIVIIEALILVTCGVGIVALSAAMKEMDGLLERLYNVDARLEKQVKRTKAIADKMAEQNYDMNHLTVDEDEKPLNFPNGD